MSVLVKPGFLGRLGGSVAGGLSPIFHPLLTTLTNQFGGDQVNPSIRNSTATVKDWQGVLQIMPIDQFRIQGARWTGTAWADDDGAGNQLFPSKVVDGVKLYQTKPDWAAGVTYAAGAEVNYNGRWYSTVAGGTDVASFGDTVVWVDQGAYSHDLGLLVEPTTTNSVLYSEQFDNAAWAKPNTSVTPNSIVAPDGNMSADLITAGATVASHAAQQLLNITITAGKKYTISTHVKAGAYSFLQLPFHSTYFGTNVYANFDIVNGTVGNVGAGVTAGVEKLQNGWYRIWATAAAIASGTSTYTWHWAIDSATAGYAASSAANGTWYDWGAQFEEAPVPTSYIPTTTAAVTRATEAGNINWPITGNFNNAEGTLVVEFTPASVKHSSGWRAVCSVNGSNIDLSGLTPSGNFYAYDGTNQAANVTAYAAEPITKAVRWSTSLNQLQIGVLLKGQYGATWSWGAATAYDGAFTLGTLISLAIGMDEPIVFRNPPIIYGKCLSTTEIEQKFGA